MRKQTATTTGRPVLGLLLVVHAAYGIMGTLSPKTLLGIFDWSGEASRTLEFLAPAHGLAMYLGGLHLALAWLCLCALGVRGLPIREPKVALEVLTTVHGLATLVGVYRVLIGLRYGLVEATANALPGSILATWLCWRAAKALDLKAL